MWCSACQCCFNPHRRVFTICYFKRFPSIFAWSFTASFHVEQGKFHELRSHNNVRHVRHEALSHLTDTKRGDCFYCWIPKPLNNIQSASISRMYSTGKMLVVKRLISMKLVSAGCTIVSWFYSEIEPVNVLIVCIIASFCVHLHPCH